MTSTEQLLDQWRRDEAAPMAGWDFSYLRGREFAEEPPWDYVRLARELVAGARSVLDMATGGGEIFSSLGPFPPGTIAIEGYHPNVRLARERLEPLGVEVIENGEVEPLPFEDNAFDVVLNRHGGLRLGEIQRVLAAGGHFLTQQVGGDNLADLMAEFGAVPQWPENLLPIVAAAAERCGLEVVHGDEWRGSVVFADVGAIVYLLKAVPWLVPGFSVDSRADALVSLYERQQAGTSLCFATSRFLLLARKR